MIGDLEFSGMCRLRGLELERKGKARRKAKASYVYPAVWGRDCFVTIKDWVLVSFDAL